MRELYFLVIEFFFFLVRLNCTWNKDILKVCIGLAIQVEEITVLEMLPYYAF